MRPPCLSCGAGPGEECGKLHTCADFGDKSCVRCYPPPKPWTDKHQRHAREWMHIRALEVLRAGGDTALANMLEVDLWNATWADRAEFAGTLDGVGLSKREVRGVLRRIDDLAEGRLKVETTCEVTGHWASADGRRGRVVTTRRRVRLVEKTR